MNNKRIPDHELAHCTAPTLIPPGYPELVDEIYMSLDVERHCPTLLPPPGHDPVELDVEAMFDESID